MNRRIVWMLFFAASIGACCRLSSVVAEAAETNVFQWATRPKLTPEQEKLLGLRKNVEILRPDSPLRAEKESEMGALEKKLGPLTVRSAKPNELIMSVMRTNVCRIHNPTKEGLVLTISIVGDVQQIGTRKASMGREAYFPPGSTLIVSNLYWTTPATAKK
jgi:hypothetical protein